MNTDEEGEKSTGNLSFRALALARGRNLSYRQSRGKDFSSPSPLREDKRFAALLAMTEVAESKRAELKPAKTIEE
jgi:hypothetical protein